ncbi:MAG: TraB/GumN family protein [Candidatus Wenzhouxiangella sp. M2_3B_020]
MGRCGWWRTTTALIVVAVSLPLNAQVFYEIVAPDGSRDWLLGTVHSEDPRVLDFPPVVEQALRQAEVVALELLPDGEMLRRLEQAMTLPDGERLQDRLDPPLYRRVARALEQDGVEPGRISRLRPWAAAMTLAQPPTETGTFMDLALAERAVLSGSAVVALESLDTQLEFFAGLGEAAHVELLEAALAVRASRTESFEELLSAYLGGDLDRLRDLAREQLAGTPDSLIRRFTERGLRARNRRMMRTAAPLLARETVLIGVGALHLPGPCGLLALLRERGYSVRPVY